MRLSHQIVLSSLNPHKWQEFQALFKPYPEVTIISPEGLIRNPEKLAFVETHPTYLDNAIAKARLTNQGCHYPALADDSGFEVEALDWKPGVRSFRYAKSPAGKPSFSRAEQDQANTDLILSELKKVPHPSHRARFTCTLALTMEGMLIHSTGVLQGAWVDTPCGANGFGYDPIFVPDGAEKTLAEMRDEEKNAISHRARAVQDLMKQIKARGIIFAKP